ncbi:MAG: hypothetical protein ACPHTD_14460, partial [Gammaproteobacteria bacterium]
ALDTIRGATELAGNGCIATLILGGDGTSRAFVKGWRDAVMLPLSSALTEPAVVSASTAANRNF